MKMRLDVDLNPPTLKVKNADEYDGNNQVKRLWDGLMNGSRLQTSELQYLVVVRGPSG